MKLIIKLSIFLFSIISFSSVAQVCSSKNICKTADLGSGFDYRSQSNYGSLTPGDTSRLKVVLYSKNLVRIFCCSDPILGKVDYRILKAVREYKRVVEKINKIEIEDPVYEKNAKGEYIVEYNEWGEAKVDEYGSPVYKVLKYNTITKSDTIWKTERFIREEEIFNSKTSDKKYFEETVQTTKSVVIELVVPPANLKPEGCVAIMVGRKFLSEDYKQFSTGK
ncbi:MAG: hypothetical protein IPO21_16985 [Bacteroidales bacterium]|nr:hypothetical protein [Bacteroidales bacterium]